MPSARDLFERARFEAQMTDPTAPITAFHADFFFLSTFAPAPVYVDQIQYPTVAHGLEAARVTSESDRDRIRHCSNPGEMVRLAKALPSRPDWEACKVDVLRTLLKQKFGVPALRTALLNTGDRPLQAHNYWRDQFWGIYEGEGGNWLGRLLMEHRDAIKNEPVSTPADETISLTLSHRIQRVTALWYDLISEEHHKDRDCHFYVTIQFSYNGERTISINHEGYVAEVWQETADSLSAAAQHLLIRICRQILRECRDADDTDPARCEKSHATKTQLIALLNDWGLQSLFDHSLTTA